MLRRLPVSGSVTALLLLSCMVVAQQPGGGFKPPQPGQILPEFQQQRLNLSAKQKTQLEELQKDVNSKLGKILTAQQKKLLQMPAGPFGPFGGFGPPPGGPGGFGPPGGGFGGGFGAPKVDNVQKQIGATAEEWKVIGPKLQKVIAARQVLTVDARTLNAGIAGKDQPGGGVGAPAPTNIISQAQAEFRAVLDDPNHTRAELQEQVAAVRKAREQARADLEAAQRDLRRLLTAEQEAVLVGLGYLE